MPCGGGRRHREVLCLAGTTRTDLSECDNNIRPDRNEDCNLESCDDGTHHKSNPVAVNLVENVITWIFFLYNEDFIRKII